MKIIDLLNKIAKGEEVPKKIRYNYTLYEFNDKKGEIVSGIIQKADSGIVVMDLGRLEGKVYGIDIGKEGDKPNYIMSGASFWSKEDGRHIGKKVQQAVEDNHSLDIYWDNIAVDNLRDMDVYIEKIDSNDIFEIDSIKDLEYLKRTFYRKWQVVS